jgi:sugar phosphate isomerase/epimerase
MKPKLAMCNIFCDLKALRDFARQHGFAGIDWSFEAESLPDTPVEESRWVQSMSALAPLEVRYHCPFYQLDLGQNDPSEARAAEVIYRRIIRLVSKVGGRFLTIHIGLGHDSTEPLSWNATINNMANLVRYAATRGIKVCLENLAWGWTSRPNLFEKIIRRSGAHVTLDLGHAEVCESVRTQQYAIEDFVTPHPERVLNAHIYHAEIPGLGHAPPRTQEEIEQRLDLLTAIGCEWWVIEIKEVEPLLLTKGILEAYLDGRGGV